MARALFVDLETTGLDSENDEIIEFGIALVDTERWSIIEYKQGLVFTASLVDKILYNRTHGGKISQFVIDMHTKSGLWQELEQLTDDGHAVHSYEEIDRAILRILEDWEVKNKPVWGSSVHFDRKFMEKRFPLSNKFLHYRIVDSSSDMMRLKTTRPELWKKIDEDPTKFSTDEPDHRVLTDIKHSIDLERRLAKWMVAPAAAVSDLPVVE